MKDVVKEYCSCTSCLTISYQEIWTVAIELKRHLRQVDGTLRKEICDYLKMEYGDT